MAPRPPSGYALAEHAATERLLNSYLRETGLADPRITLEQLRALPLPSGIHEELCADGCPLRVELPRTGRLLLGTLRRGSPSGHHRYGPVLWQCSATGVPGRRVDGALHLARILVAELASEEAEPVVRERRMDALLRHIQNSVDKTALYLDRSAQREPWPSDGEGPSAFLAAEQRILFGHPFHPTPKSSEGFTPSDLEQYAPELGATFPLHYLAASPELIEEDFLPGAGENVLPAAVREEAAALLTSTRGGWSLLPCHPWQVRHLHGLPGFRRLLEEQRVVHLGPLGKSVHPTSSVRTVLAEGHPFFFKLPLGVRITNMVRVNPPEQLQRSLGISRVVALLQARAPQPNFSILLETGYRALAPRDWAPEERHALAEHTAVLFRDARPCAQTPAPLVVAALLEPSPGHGEPAIMRAVRRATGVASGPLKPSGVEAWLRRYLQVSMMPLLRLFIEEGLSLEAHVQNSLLTLKDGWPERFHVRDLEGASLSRDRAAARGFHDAGCLTETHSALYDDTEAWQRLAYYFFVNHLSHLLVTLALHGPSDEPRLWKVVRNVLESNALSLRATGGAPYLEALLDGPTLPAKANLTSRFRERGERPLYLDVPNPIREQEVPRWS